MGGTLVRVLSAIGALALLAATANYGGLPGIKYLGLVIIAIGIGEFVKMAYPASTTPLGLRLGAIGIMVLALIAATVPAFDPFMVFGIASAASVASLLWSTRNRFPNDKILDWAARFFMGLIYFVAFPAFALRLLDMSGAITWFSFLLVVVFFGDTFAYFGGRFLGKKKLMPEISPKKTVAGAWTGLIGSLIGGVAVVHFLAPHIPWGLTAAFAVLCGFLAQAGDLFVSLVKRVANVKDSGAIMPGHGGVLDRLDGIYIAAPIVYYFANRWDFFAQYF